jgi:hypothetical protein
MNDAPPPADADPADTGEAHHDGEDTEPEVEGHMLNVPLIGIKVVEQTKPQLPKTKEMDFGTPTTGERPAGD